MILTGGKRFHDSDLHEHHSTWIADGGHAGTGLDRIADAVVANTGHGVDLLFHFVSFRQTTLMTLHHSLLGGRRQVKLPKGADEWRSLWLPVYAKALLSFSVNGRTRTCHARRYPQHERHYSYMLPQCARPSREEAVECVRLGLRRIKPSSPVPSWFLKTPTPVYVVADPSSFGAVYDAALAAAKDTFPNEALLAELM